LEIDCLSIPIRYLQIGLSALFAGAEIAFGAARLQRLEPRKTGALYGCGAFTNIGSIGAMVCFVFIGEGGFALVPIYTLFQITTKNNLKYQA
jgi:predicted permease